MAIENRWLISGRIIHMDLIGDLTVGNIKAGSQSVIDLLESSEYDTIHIIGNDSQMGKIPVSLRLFSEAADFMRHPKLGWFILYPSDNQFTKFMGIIMSSMTNVNHCQYPTLVDCLGSLARIDPSLPSLEEMIALSSVSANEND